MCVVKANIFKGYSFNLAGPTQEDSYTVSFTKRNNTPQEGCLKKNGIQLGMVVPIKGMSNEEYLNIWRQHSNNFEHNDIVGGFLLRKVQFPHAGIRVHQNLMQI